MDMALSNKQLEVILKKINLFNEKNEVLFDFCILQNKTSTISLNDLGLRHLMIISKYLLVRDKSRP